MQKNRNGNTPPPMTPTYMTTIITKKPSWSPPQHSSPRATLHTTATSIRRRGFPTVMPHHCLCENARHALPKTSPLSTSTRSGGEDAVKDSETLNNLCTCTANEFPERTTKGTEIRRQSVGILRILGIGRSRT